jgi:multidrug efflux pump subunit AcrA (membrane-fusion protein)
MIVTVAHNDGADAVFDVPATLFRQVSPDALISIALTDDPTVRTVGQVREVAPQADPVTRSYRVKVGLTDWPQASLEPTRRCIRQHRCGRGPRAGTPRW